MRPRFSALQRAEIAEITEVVRPIDYNIFGFSALQRAEIAEIVIFIMMNTRTRRFSALQRAEIAEIRQRAVAQKAFAGFSALQRAEIAEIRRSASSASSFQVSVLFNEPKLLKSICLPARRARR